MARRASSSGPRTLRPAPRARRRRNRRAPRPLHTRLPTAADCRRAVGRVSRRVAPLIIGAAIVGASTGALLFGHWWLQHTDRFALEHIEVRGGARVDDDAVRRLAALPPGVNLFAIELEAVSRGVELSPWVVRARASRALPNTLVVDVDEREPQAVVELDGLYLVDDSGEPFKRANVAAGDADGLPVVTGLSRSTYRADRNAAEDFIRRGVAAFHAFRHGGKRPPVGEIHLDPRRGVTLLTRERAMAIALGHGRALAPLDKRLAAFDAAWRALAEDERALAAAVYVNNATHPNRVTVGFRNAED